MSEGNTEAVPPPSRDSAGCLGYSGSPGSGEARVMTTQTEEAPEHFNKSTPSNATATVSKDTTPKVSDTKQTKAEEKKMKAALKQEEKEIKLAHDRKQRMCKVRLILFEQYYLNIFCIPCMLNRW